MRCCTAFYPQLERLSFWGYSQASYLALSSFLSDVFLYFPILVGFTFA